MRIVATARWPCKPGYLTIRGLVNLVPSAEPLMETSGPCWCNETTRRCDQNLPLHFCINLAEMAG